MKKLLNIRIKHGYQAIPDIRKAIIQPPFRGLPLLDEKKCVQCKKCIVECPVDAISIKPLSLDMGKCIFCGDCQRICPSDAITFTQFYKIAAEKRNGIIVTGKTTAEQYHESAISVRKDIKRIFGGSLKLREVSAAGCNGCEWELNACANVNFDMGRFGVEIVASPRHADGLLITGPISKNMARALEDAYESIPAPKIVILAGSCAISGGLFGESPACNREFLIKYNVDLFIPGCPVHPLTVVNGIIDFLGK